MFFGNSGAEANECAIKAARKYAAETKGDDCNVIVTLNNSFHGRTLTTLSATGQDHYHELFRPLTPGFMHVTAGDMDELTALSEKVKIAAVMIECIQGEGGVNLISPEWAQAAAEAARAAGAIVMADEVQTGIGRTGTFLASDALGFNPEVVTLAKGIAGGIPMGACLFRGKAADVFVAGDHQSTFAGNPLACAAGCVVAETVSNPSFLDRVNHAGDYIRGAISSWNLPIVKEVRGKGLMIGTQIDPSVKPFDIEVKCLEKGLCTTVAGSDVVRFLPPLTITDKEIDEGLKIFKEVMESFCK